MSLSEERGAQLKSVQDALLCGSCCQGLASLGSPSLGSMRCETCGGTGIYVSGVQESLEVLRTRDLYPWDFGNGPRWMDGCRQCREGNALDARGQETDETCDACGGTSDGDLPRSLNDVVSVASYTPSQLLSVFEISREMAHAVGFSMAHIAFSKGRGTFGDRRSWPILEGDHRTRVVHGYIRAIDKIGPLVVEVSERRVEVSFSMRDVVDWRCRCGR